MTSAPRTGRAALRVNSVQHTIEFFHFTRMMHLNLRLTSSEAFRDLLYVVFYIGFIFKYISPLNAHKRLYASDDGLLTSES